MIWLLYLFNLFPPLSLLYCSSEVLVSENASILHVFIRRRDIFEFDSRFFVSHIDFYTNQKSFIIYVQVKLEIITIEERHS